MTVQLTKYYSRKVRQNTRPSNTGEVDGEIPPILNPDPDSRPVTPPVAKRYASESEMIADQINQRSGYLYFDGTNTWWYLGTSGGVIGDYEAFGGGVPETRSINSGNGLQGGGNLSADRTISMKETNLTTGVSLSFANLEGSIHGTEASPVTGNITFDFTNALKGCVNYLIHYSTTAVTFPSSAIIVGRYSLFENNYIGTICLNNASGFESVLLVINQSS